MGIETHPTGIKYSRAVAKPLPTMDIWTQRRNYGERSLIALTDPARFSGVLNADLVHQTAAGIISANKCLDVRATLISIGTSSGRNSTGISQPLYAIEVVPKKGPKLPPYVFTGGHHDSEYAGPHSVLQLLDIVLSELKERNPEYVRQFARHPMVFIPLANPDGALQKEDENFRGVRIASNPLDDAGFVIDPNVYETYLEKSPGNKAMIWPEAAQIMTYLSGFMSFYGTPQLTVDFHETAGYTGTYTIDNKRLNRYVYIAMKLAALAINRDPATHKTTSVNADFLVLNQALEKAVRLYGPSISDELIIGKPEKHFRHSDQKFMGICEWLKSRGSDNSFIIETPNVEHTFPVGDRVKLAMLAMEEILLQTKTGG